MKKIQIGVLASGNGTNLQAIINASHSKILNHARVTIVISNKKEAFALKRAERVGIKALYMDPKDFPSRVTYFEGIKQALVEKKVDMVCLAGFLLKLEPNLLQAFPNRILNIHPALLPKFGGKGMYGHFVHEAVLKNKEKESGCTVHRVDEEFDHGPILLQKKVLVLPRDTPETLAERVLKEEQKLYPRAIALFIKENFPMTGDR